jgi:hypothetical protein
MIREGGCTLKSRYDEQVSEYNGVCRNGKGAVQDGCHIVCNPDWYDDAPKSYFGRAFGDYGNGGHSKGQWHITATPAHYGVVVDKNWCVDDTESRTFHVFTKHVWTDPSLHCAQTYGVGTLYIGAYDDLCEYFNGSPSTDNWFCPKHFTYKNGYCERYESSTVCLDWKIPDGRCDPRNYRFPDGTRWPHRGWAVPSGGIKDSGGSTMYYSSKLWRTNPVSGDFARRECVQLVEWLSCASQGYTLSGVGFTYGSTNACP